MRNSRLRRARPGVWLWLAMVLACSACAATGPGPAPGAAQNLTPVSVSLGDVSLNKVAFLVAADNGIYQKYGLDVHEFITAGAADRIRRSGITVPDDFVDRGNGDDAEISVGGGSPLINSMTTDARTTQRVILATTDSEAGFHIVSNPAVTSIDDLKGKRLGFTTPGSVSNLIALALVRQKGWTPGRDISLISDGADYSALKAGRVDAFIGSEIYYTMAAKNGAKDLADLSDYHIPIAGSGINAEVGWYEAHRDTAVRFLKATIESYALMRKKPELVYAALAKWYGVTDPRQQQDMYSQVARFPEKPYPAVDGIKLVMQLFPNPELQRHAAEDFYDSSVVGELDRSGFIDRANAT
ncbi:ABC transporter substrate-binding protein [Pseudonocardia alaniniphila]|uniref:ABC transporter substrate-binding protein n=1 Tax=Pseudonocardia alaniniphila TaxID=75291 RepID=A0ABS9TET7_9PSEU|nr:ABC transporter substrate-binding protein [Pseudonocardia alaniniphila]MCH6167054.1 ABC transporter substrate-binding protein [Pseudonocardia alaniniphila]